MSVQELQAACDAALANPAFQPADGVTHCNEAARAIAHAMGYFAFDPPELLADDMVVILNAGGVWAKVDGPTAAAHAVAGGLAFAAMSSGQLGEAHGHLSALYPLPMQFSGSLNKLVPMLANVGQTVGVSKESAAFPVALGEPDYFIF